MRDECEPEVLWRLGDPWRRFEDEIAALQDPVTVVTENGSARIISVLEGWQQRVPLEGGHRMAQDRVAQTLASVAATSCGVSTVDSMRGRHRTSRVILLLRSDHPYWLRSEVGQAVFREAPTWTWSAAGHPDMPCGALHCVQLD